MSGQWFPDARKAVQHLKRSIVERKRQEPRQKFIGDHQLIHDRKKNEPCIPILPGHDQEAWFAKLESNRVWKIVFEYVTTPWDVTSAFFACELFRKHLEEKRKMMMLPNMFGVLRDSGHLKYSGFARNLTDKIKEDSRDVLNQRLVSKAWKKAVEGEFLVHWGFSQPFQNLEIGDWGGPATCRFENVDDVDKAIHKLRDPKSCESLVRMMEVKLDEADEDELSDEREVYEVIFSKLVQFVERHGEAVWALKYEQIGSADFKYREIREVISRLPNLKALYLDYCWIDWGHEEDDNEESHVKLQEVQARLQKSVRHNPFPTLSSLESLSLYFTHGQNEFLVAEILNNCENLKAVCFDCWDSNGDRAIPPFVWDALRNLRLENLDFIYDVQGHLFMRDFLQLRDFNWPLKYFRIHYSNDMNKDENVFDIGASNIFTVLSRFNETLEHFTLDGMINVRLVDDRKSVIVDFPKLKTLELPHIVNL